MDEIRHEQTEVKGLTRTNERRALIRRSPSPSHSLKDTKQPVASAMQAYNTLIELIALFRLSLENPTLPRVAVAGIECSVIW
jgi:hypothetical protein